MPSIEYLIITASSLLLAAVLASKASQRLGVPLLLVFLLLGMLAGSEGIGGIPYDDPLTAQWLGVVALALILFAGGLETDWETVRPVLWRGLSLSTLGVLFTAGLVGVFSSWLLEVKLVEGLLLGAIVSSTDAAAVFAVLRSRNASLKGRIKPLLELESGSNDPMAVLLTVGLIRLLSSPPATPVELGLLFVRQVALGAATGLAMGRLAVLLVNRLKLETEGLYPVLTLALALGAYGAAATAGGNGFLAVYLAGIVLGNEDFIHKRSLIRFHDGLAWLMQIAMFLALGLLVFPSRLAAVAGVGMLIACFLMFVARPASVFLSLAFARVTTRARLLVAWVGLRGAVPIILATFPMVAGVPHAGLFFDVVFFIVITSVLLQGTTLPTVAGWLGLRAPARSRRAYPLEFAPTRKTRSSLVEVSIPRDSPAAGRQVLDLRLPKSALIVLLSRNDDYLTPRGGTAVQAGDTLLVLADKEDSLAVREALDPGSARAAAEDPAEK